MMNKKPFADFTLQDIQEAASFIKPLEGLRLKAYKCPADVYTIGYGHTAHVTEGMTITEGEADKLLIEDLLRFKASMIPLIKVPVTLGQFVALMSFTYNVGIGNFKQSTLLRKLNEGDDHDASFEFSRWIKANGHILGGLVKRRTAERAMFDSEN
ncbi:MAG: lysozyme [Sutterella sp.]|nr:lysozyme [Sutterella sp.]